MQFNHLHQGGIMAFVNIEFAQNKSMALVLLRLKRKINEKKVKN